MTQGTRHFRLTPGVLSEARAQEFLKAVNSCEGNDLSPEYFGRENDKCWRFLRVLPKTKVVLEFKFSIKVLSDITDGEETWIDSGNPLLSPEDFKTCKRRYNWLAIDQGCKHLISPEVLEEIRELAGDKLLPAGALGLF
jgi:hypothetical protein